MSFINFLRTGKRSSKKLKTTKKLTRLEVFERCWDSLRISFEVHKSDGDLLQAVRNEGAEMVDLLNSETGDVNSTPPCYEYLLSKDVINKLCKYAKKLSRKNLPTLHATIITIADVILAAGTSDRPLLGHHSQVILPTTDLIKSFLPELGCIPSSTNSQNPRLHHAFLYLLYALSWQLSSSPECTGFFIDPDSSESLLVHAVPYIGSGGFVNSRIIDPRLEAKNLFLSDLAIEVVERLLVVWHPECVSFLNDVSPLLASSVVNDLCSLLSVKPPQLIQSPELLERIAIRLRFLTASELSSLSPTLHAALLSHFKAQVVSYFEGFFHRGLIPSSAVIAVMRYTIEQLGGKSFYQPLCDIYLNNITTLTTMLSASDSRSLQLLLLLTIIVDKEPGSCQKLLGRHETPSGEDISLGKIDLTRLFHRGLSREESNKVAYKDASAAYKTPYAFPSTSINTNEPPNGIFPAVVSIVKRSVQVEMLVAVFTFLTTSIRTEYKPLLELLFNPSRGILSSALIVIANEINSFTSKHGVHRVKHLSQQARRELGIIGGADRKGDPTDLIFSKWVIIEEWRAELQGTITAHREALMIQQMGKKDVPGTERVQPPPLFLGDGNVIKGPRDNPIRTVKVSTNHIDPTTTTTTTAAAT